MNNLPTEDWRARFKEHTYLYGIISSGGENSTSWFIPKPSKLSNGLPDTLGFL